MEPLTQERILSLTRHIMTGGGLGTAGVSVVPGEQTLLGLPLSAWGGLATFLAGCVNAWFSKPRESADGSP